MPHWNHLLCGLQGAICVLLRILLLHSPLRTAHFGAIFPCVFSRALDIRLHSKPAHRRPAHACRHATHCRRSKRRRRHDLSDTASMHDLAAEPAGTVPEEIKAQNIDGQARGMTTECIIVTIHSSYDMASKTRHRARKLAAQKLRDYSHMTMTGWSHTMAATSTISVRKCAPIVVLS